MLHTCPTLWSLTSLNTRDIAGVNLPQTLFALQCVLKSFETLLIAGINDFPIIAVNLLHKHAMEDIHLTILLAMKCPNMFCY